MYIYMYILYVSLIKKPNMKFEIHTTNPRPKSYNDITQRRLSILEVQRNKKSCH